MSCVGAIDGTGLAGAAPVVTAADGGASAGFGWAAADCCTGSAVAAGSGAAAGLLAAAIGLAFGTGTVRLATCGIDFGGRGAPLTWVIGSSGPGGP